MVTLRPLRQTDDADLVHFLNQQDVVQYLSSRIPSPYTQADADWWINIGCKQDGLVFAIEWHQQFCGVAGAAYMPFEYAHTAEVGYWIGKDFWGKGIASEALRQLCEKLFTQTDKTRLIAPVFDGNPASMSVLEKNGFQQEGVFSKAIFKDGAYYDEYRYFLLHPDLR